MAITVCFFVWETEVHLTHDPFFDSWSAINMTNTTQLPVRIFKVTIIQQKFCRNVSLTWLPGAGESAGYSLTATLSQHREGERKKKTDIVPAICMTHVSLSRISNLFHLGRVSLYGALPFKAIWHQRRAEFQHEHLIRPPPPQLLETDRWQNGRGSHWCHHTKAIKSPPVLLPGRWGGSGNRRGRSSSNNISAGMHTMTFKEREAKRQAVIDGSGRYYICRLRHQLAVRLQCSVVCIIRRTVSELQPAIVV